MTDKAWCVYILECSDRSYYTGISNDLERRLKQHNGELPGGSKYTLSRRPVKLVLQEAHPDRSTATQREMAIKSLTRQQKVALVRDFGSAAKN